MRVYCKEEQLTGLRVKVHQRAAWWAGCGIDAKTVHSFSGRVEVEVLHKLAVRSVLLDSRDLPRMYIDCKDVELHVRRCSRSDHSDILHAVDVIVGTGAICRQDRYNSLSVCFLFFCFLSFSKNLLRTFSHTSRPVFVSHQECRFHEV